MMNKELFRRGDYGYSSLADFVDRYMANSFNNGRKHYKNMLMIAADVYKELYWKTLRVTKTKRVYINKGTQTAHLPHDCLRVVGIKTYDYCDMAQNFSYAPKKNLHRAVATSHCTCGCSGELCLALSQINQVTEDIVFGEETYAKITKSKLCANGDLLQEITEPFAKKNGQGGTDIVFRTYQNRVASLTLKRCGCVEDTVSNRTACYDYCGCPVVCCTPSCELDLRDRHLNGQYKIDEDIWTVFFFNTSSSYVDITYITNGDERTSEIMIPDYCQEAMYAGLFLGSIRFRTLVPDSQKRAARIEYAMEKQELYEFLNPINLDEFSALQGEFPKW